jgi:hypothetical protein
MRLRSVVLALMLASGLAGAASKPPKRLKVQKHAVTTPKAVKHNKQAATGVVHKSPKVAKHKVSTPKMAKQKVAKHKTAKFKPHKA